ncbi:MAG TPA: hypothetical protein VIM79_16510, partial [Niastella sp.]
MQLNRMGLVFMIFLFEKFSFYESALGEDSIQLNGFSIEVKQLLVYLKGLIIESEGSVIELEARSVKKNVFIIQLEEVL